MTLAAAYALAGQSMTPTPCSHRRCRRQRLMDYTVRSFLRSIPQFSMTHIGRNRSGELPRDCVKRACAIISTSRELSDSSDRGPAGRSRWTDAGQRSRRHDDPHRCNAAPARKHSKPLVLTTTPANPTIPGAIQVSRSNSGKLDDEWQTTVGALAAQATNGDKERPIVAFSFSINHWQSRNLVLRLIALGYKKVYWYRGGWEAWECARSSEGSTHRAIPAPELKIGYDERHSNTRRGLPQQKPSTSTC